MTINNQSPSNPLLDPEMLALFMPQPDQALIDASPKAQEELMEKMLSGYGIFEVFSKDVLDDQHYAPLVLDKDLVDFYGSIILSDIVLKTLDSSKPVVSKSLGIEDRTNEKTAADRTASTGAASGVDIPGWNPWMAASYLVNITMAMMEMARVMRLARLTEMGARVAAMGLIMESAYNIGNAIKEAAEKQADMLMMQGIGSAIQAAFGGLSMVTGMLGAAGSVTRTVQYNRAMASSKPPTGGMEGFKYNWFTGSASVLGSASMGLGSLGQGIGGMVSSFGQIGPTIEKGLIERYQKVQEGLKDVYTQLQSSSSESDKNLAELVSKCLEMLKMVYEQALQAHKGLGPTQ
ncbi:hypothetical protein [Criblamydia sequanensis]|uniref:Membrane protein n=1 Tax=Candidatus Criblamydia sequanensis CRIB-18 TaxID=1437425 RepID=A0A090D073_9BACT|nr:hypothetical protein [Criblamydia sequanensis]CDR32953.1 putative membrane protein [Criblamydia sequanensis CRIB-18]